MNYTIQEPNVGYFLEGYDTQWAIVSQNALGNIFYLNLPSGTYTFHLAILDSAGERVLEERKFELVKEGEFYEQSFFQAYLLLVLSLLLIWCTWLVVQRQLNASQEKLNMANETVMAIAKSVDAKDVRTHQHSMRVAEYSVMIADEMNCFKWWQRTKALANLKKAAQMHDIGKIGVPDSVLNKVGRLDNEEYAKMKSHVVSGSDILKDFTLVDHVVDGTRYHHERYDGRGYPEGLKGEEIPLFGRIIAVADAFDAMTSNRVYRNHMDTDYVMNEMKRGRGTQFDPNALDAFLRLVDKGVIDLDKIYAEKKAEVMEVDQKTKEELERRESVPANYHTFKGEAYQGRYVSGIAAGMKIKEMIKEEIITPDQAIVGFVAAYPTSEVISGYTAFLLGVRAIVPQAVMEVSYTNTWSSYAHEKSAAKELIADGCVVISQHTDTIGPAIACEEASEFSPVYFVGYNQSMSEVAPGTSLVTSRICWDPYVLAAVEAVWNDKSIESVVTGRIHGSDVSAGFEKGWVEMDNLNFQVAAKGTQEAMNKVIDQFKRGNGDFVFKGNYLGVNPDDPSDTFNLKNGYKENENTSYPFFHYVLQDVITVKE
ncbi:MAG: HD domain-containing protein [Butyrivibrio sp.]|nr:HD domain-containing protein [Butyrivibrio sp.]